VNDPFTSSEDMNESFMTFGEPPVGRAPRVRSVHAEASPA
jgi:hypothetical protein